MRVKQAHSHRSPRGAAGQTFDPFDLDHSQKVSEVAECRHSDRPDMADRDSRGLREDAGLTERSPSAHQALTERSPSAHQALTKRSPSAHQALTERSPWGSRVWTVGHRAGRVTIEEPRRARALLCRRMPTSSLVRPRSRRGGRAKDVSEGALRFGSPTTLSGQSRPTQKAAGGERHGVRAPWHASAEGERAR